MSNTIKNIVARIKAKWITSKLHAWFVAKKLAHRLNKAEKKAVKLAFDTGRKHYIMRFGTRFYVGDRTETRNRINNINRITGRRFEWRKVVIAETS